MYSEKLPVFLYIRDNEQCLYLFRLAGQDKRSCESGRYRRIFSMIRGLYSENKEGFGCSRVFPSDKN